MEMEHLAPAPSQLGAGATDKPMLTCDEDLPTKMRRPAAAAAGQHPPPDACFDCNICLDFAADPVVTLCGHLYCWPCIYKWLRVPDAQFDPATADFDAAAPRNQQCPVCKAALSESALVPLYGRGGGGGGGNGKGSPGPAAAAAPLQVPRRPLPSMLPLREDDPSYTAASHPRGHPHHRDALSHTHGGPPRQVSRDYLGSVMSSTTVAHPLFHGVAMLPFLLFCDNAGAGSSSGMYYADPYYNTRRGVAERRQERNSARSLHRVSCFLFLCVILCLLLF